MSKEVKPNNYYTEKGWFLRLTVTDTCFIAKEPNNFGRKFSLLETVPKKNEKMAH
jgi:hypothetical protein